MRRATKNRRAASILSRPSNGRLPAVAASRRSLLPAARRVLWPFLRACARGPRRALRERLRAFLRSVTRGQLLRLVSRAAIASSVALALAGPASPAEAIELADVAAGQSGFVVRRMPGPEYAGSEVSGAGDVNGDGLADVLMGVPGASTSYVVFGKWSPEAVDLAEIAEGTGGFVIRGEFSDDRSGWSVAGAGDVDGDGRPDLVIGAPGPSYGTPYGKSGERSYVVFGRAKTDPVDLADVAAGEGGFVIVGARSGGSVSGAGDVNGDGRSDLLIRSAGFSSIYPRLERAGASYVVFGKETGDAVDLADVAVGQGGFVIRDEGTFEGDCAISGARDVNRDGFADVLLGPPGVSTSYVVFGKDTTEPVELVDVAAGAGGFVIRAPGRSVAGAGDVDGDGFGDLLIGASYAGASYVVFGKDTTEPVDLAGLAAGEGGFVIRGESEGDFSGWSVSGAGDVDGDRLADVLIGAPGASASYVVFGKTTGDAVDLADVAAGQGGFAITGEDRGGFVGASVAGAEDVNGDGVPDFAIASSRSAVDGEAYVVFGPLREGVPRFRRGEVNGDSEVDLSDAVVTLGFLYLGDDAPMCFDAADANDDGDVDLSDAVAVLGFLYRGEAAPPVPGPSNCGIDSTEDALGCDTPSADCR